MAVIGIDIGTTGCKCGLYENNGTLKKIIGSEYNVIREQNEHYIDIKSLLECVKKLIIQCSINQKIEALCISSLGESFVPVGENYEILDNAMLYTDLRGKAETEKLVEKLSCEKIISISGLSPHCMYSLPKIMWFKKNKPEIYKKTKKILLIGDFIGYILSGNCIIDYSLASRTMAFDIIKKEWSKEILDIAEIDINLFSSPRPSGSIIGKVRDEIASELSLSSDCVLVVGGQDQVLSCLGAGVLTSGYCVDGTGTVECITPLFDKPINDASFSKKGYACVPYVLKEKYVTYMFSYSGGALLKWFRDKIKRNSLDKHFYSEFNKFMPKEPTELLVLPYFAGAGTPYMDMEAKGAILNLTLSTTDGEIYRALMESATFEIRLNIEKVHEFGVDINAIIATGGGAKSKEWLQIKADILGVPVYPLKVSEAGINGAAMLALTALGFFDSIDSTVNKMVEKQEPIYPNITNVQIYDKQFSKYKKIYDLLKEIR